MSAHRVCEDREQRACGMPDTYTGPCMNTHRRLSINCAPAVADNHMPAQPLGAHVEYHDMQRRPQRHRRSGRLAGLRQRRAMVAGPQMRHRDAPAPTSFRYRLTKGQPPLLDRHCTNVPASQPLPRSLCAISSCIEGWKTVALHWGGSLRSPIRRGRPGTIRKGEVGTSGPERPGTAVVPRPS
jgi:hypothetical protein